MAILYSSLSIARIISCLLGSAIDCREKAYLLTDNQHPFVSLSTDARISIFVALHCTSALEFIP